MSINKTDINNISIDDVITRLDQLQHSVDRLDDKQQGNTTSILESVEKHDRSTAIDHEDIIHKLYIIERQNEELNTKILFLKSEVKNNSTIKRIMSISLTFFIFFNIAFLLNFFADYNIGINQWYIAGLIISFIIYLISLLIHRDLKNV